MSGTARDAARTSAPDEDRGVGLRVEGLARLVGHADHLARGQDLDAVAPMRGAPELGLDALGIADEHDADRGGAAELGGRLDRRPRRVVPAHRVERDPKLLVVPLRHRVASVPDAAFVVAGA
jgi:hypothetical protein